ncbi:hypothetical protein EV385_6405 [Krasilnikovia cinnamomea]|uniref:Gametolysin peptidase M11 n=1 Tax=Krasilnikovia cinnamomea TaxID=349313 RepID=A0A4Q7ZU18_9ACTN|nr:Ig-like domain-containing protein [Krasilnikovia cinnamomea]RZU54454.1 hypothetical protein EV385_6405 [Krasilnikovia cinnamomea]
MIVRLLAHAAAAPLAVGGMMFMPTAALAAAPAAYTTTVLGTYTQVLPDDISPAPGTSAAPTAMVTIGDTIVRLPAGTTAGLASGAEVAVTVSAPVSADTTAEVAAAVATGQATVLSTTAAGGVAPIAASVAGAHSLTVVPVYWGAKDAQTTTTLRATADKVAAYWSAQTDGGITISTIDVRDWTVIPKPASCNDYGAATNAALAATGVSGATLRNHVLLYWPRMGCSWAGLGSVGGGNIWIDGTTAPDVWEHEFGHNLGLSHANAATCGSVPLSASCTVREYDDRDVMGFGRGGDGYNLNSALADVLGALTNPAVGVDGTVVTLPPITSVSQTRALKIPLTGSTLYVDYRPQTGRDAGLPAGWAGVQVHQRLTDKIDSRSLNMNPAVADSRAMPVGKAWAIPGTLLTLTVEEVTASGARVRVGNIYNDTTAPSTPAAPTVTGTAKSGEYVAGPVKFSWPAVTDAESGVAEYRVSINGQTTVTKTPSLSVPALTGTVAVSVTAVNKVGKVSAASPTVTVRGDNTAPSTPALTTPSNAATVGNAPRLAWSAATDDGAGLDRYELFLDKSKVGTADRAATSATVTLPGTALNGQHTLSVVAVDKVGNRSAADARTVVLAKATVPAPTKPTITNDASGTKISWTPPAQAAAGYDVLVDGVVREGLAGSATSWTLATGAATEGAHQLGVRARDSVGNASAVIVAKGTLDTSAPTQPKVAPPAVSTFTGNLARITWATATDAQSGIGKYAVLVDDVEVMRTLGTVRSASVPVPDGEHRIKVVAINGNGLPSADADALGVTVTATPTAPTPAKITAPAANAAISAQSTTVTWAAAVDPGGLDHYEVQVDGVTAATSTTTSASVSLDAGPHSLKVVAVDKSGLTSASAVVAITVDRTAPTVSTPAVTLRAGAAGAGVPVIVTATATDPSAICAVTVAVDGTPKVTGKTGTVRVETMLPRASSATVTVTATDCAGNSAVGTREVSLTSAAESAGQFAGTWAVAQAAGYLDGAARTTTAANASVSWSFTGTQAAWIGSRSATGYGVAYVYLDDRKVATVDTKATTALDKQVLWAGTTTPGEHTLKIVAVGTPDRPKVVVDGFTSLS